jgi:hypothetical protein
MQDTKIALATCRCGRYVFACRVSGIAVTADIEPLGAVSDVMAALAARRDVYAVLVAGGVPQRLKRLGGPGTVWEPNGRHLVAAHACGSSAMAAVPVEVAPQGPQKAPAQPGRPSGGFHHPPAPADGSQGHTAARRTAGYSGHPRKAATPAIRPRFSPPPRSYKCDACGRLIKKGEEFTAIEHGRYMWAQHSYDCCDTEEWLDEEEASGRIRGEGHRRQIKAVGFDAALDLWRKGMQVRPIEDLELPE